MRPVELRVVRPLSIDHAAREAIVDVFRVELVALARFRLDAPPCTPLACLSAAELLGRTERSPRRPPRVGPTHVIRAHAPTGDLRLELQLRATPSDDAAADRAPVPFLRVRGASRDLLEAALPRLASAFGASEAFIVSRAECRAPRREQTVAAPAPWERPSYLVPALVQAPSLASSGESPESSETLLAPPAHEIARLIAEAEPSLAFQRAASVPPRAAARADESSSGETLAEPAPADLARSLARALPFSGTAPSPSSPAMDVDAYAVLQALRAARGDDDPLVRTRYADPSPEGRARLHVEMANYLRQDPAARARFEERVAHFARKLAEI